MTKRRGRGEGGLHWDEARQRWIASVTAGYTPAGKRIVRKGSGKTKTEARAKLREKIREYEDGLAIATNSLTVADAVTDWLTYGLTGTVDNTRDNYAVLARTHIISGLGARKLRDLSATDVDRWLADKARSLSTRTLRLLHSILNRAIIRAMARDKVKRNVVALCHVPQGQQGRPSKSLTLDQAKALLAAAADSPMHAYIVVSLLTGARTEELRALTWDRVDLDGKPDAQPPIPPSIEVWHSVRVGGDTKTRKSRRTLALPVRCVAALRHHRERQGAGLDGRLVFASAAGTELDRHNVLRAFRPVVKQAGLHPDQWTPRELRHSFVSLLSDSGMRVEDIADLCGHSGTTVTETVYRHQLRPVLLQGAVAMDEIFGVDHREG
ncbi:site-specific integrase [Planosporangium mesophilum]|uniref:Site-specific integrase n=1 Tax=Planosporangium mesophilum TaxID=689768 RepID=A0A8J3TDH6_9ACTN|nr:site-specific integrase [Planosporangium mesophilum]NJC85363.1 site-specific integrase [Planosporangium mesophilum]GII23172.1 site-specific integrase [Planosporangium mesophilum]